MLEVAYIRPKRRGKAGGVAAVAVLLASAQERAP